MTLDDIVMYAISMCLEIYMYIYIYIDRERESVPSSSETQPWIFIEASESHLFSACSMPFCRLSTVPGLQPSGDLQNPWDSE